MAIYTVKCPACGSATELNDEKEFGFCTECGARITPEEAELFTISTDPSSGSPATGPESDAPAAAITEAPAAAFPETAEDAVTETCSDVPAEPAADAAPAPSLSEGIPAEPVAAQLPNAEQVQYLILHQPQPLDSTLFRNSDECAAYVKELHGLLLDAADRYSRMNHAEEATCLDFLERGISYCEMLDTKRMRFLAGTHEENGKTVEDYGSFPVSKDVLRDLRQIRERFVNAYNDFYRPKIAASKAALDESKTKIKALPGAMRFYHSFCTPLMGILTAALFAIGLVPILTMEKYSFGLNVNTLIMIIGACLFVFWIVSTILWIFKGASARQLYKAADRQVGEIRTYRSKLKS